jgi:hypothetical protein
MHRKALVSMMGICLALLGSQEAETKQLPVASSA